jgi:5'-methylthioadenosine phosphorylase
MALRHLGCNRVLAFASTGSMRSEIALGTLVIPDDFLCLEPITFHDDDKGHMIPGFDHLLRATVVESLQNEIALAHKPMLTSGVYVQTIGPRFETCAEIRLLATQVCLLSMDFLLAFFS